MISKKDLIEILVDGSPYTKKETAHFLENVLDAIASSLVKGEAVSLYQLGKFTVRQTPPRTARNPRTGAPIQIPTQRKITFRPAKALKERINQ